METAASRTAPSRSAQGRRSRDRPSFELIESKLHPPGLRPGIVARTALIERMLAASAGTVVCVVAPPGYGKTTLLAQWAQRRGDRVAPIDPETLQILASPTPQAPPTVVARLAAAMSARSEPVDLVLDHVELLHNRQCLDALGQLAVQLSGGSQLVLAARTRPRLPLGRLRGQGRLTEVGAADLQMSQTEARALLAGAGLRLAEDHAAELHRRTEGWPVGLYLAALALQATGTALSAPDAGWRSPATTGSSSTT